MIRSPLIQPQGDSHPRCSEAAVDAFHRSPASGAARDGEGEPAAKPANLPAQNNCGCTDTTTTPTTSDTHVDPPTDYNTSAGTATRTHTDDTRTAQWTLIHRYKFVLQVRLIPPHTTAAHHHARPPSRRRPAATKMVQNMETENGPKNGTNYPSATINSGWDIGKL